MQAIIEEGKNIEKAIERAAKRLGVSKNEVEHEVIRKEKKGFLGLLGGSPAIVKVWLKEREKLTKIKLRGTPRYKAKRQSKTNRRMRDYKPTQNNYLKGNEIKQKIAIILDKMGFDAEISLSIRNSVYFYKIDVDEEYEGLLIGRKGITLGALQHIINRIIEPNENGNRKPQIVLDICDYRERRDKELINRANSLAKKVKRSGNEIVLEPLNSSDRRVIHQALRKDSEVRTYTIGNGQKKTLIIAPAN